jgi:hypothetical protein
VISNDHPGEADSTREAVTVTQEVTVQITTGNSAHSIIQDRTEEAQEIQELNSADLWVVAGGPSIAPLQVVEQGVEVDLTPQEAVEEDISLPLFF